MSEITEMPEAPQPRKPTQWKIIIPIAIVVVLCCICLVVVGVLAYMGMQGTGPLSMLATATPTRTPTKTPTPTTELSIIGDWDIYYDWKCDGNYNGPVLITFFYDYTYVLTEDSDTGYGTWYIAGDYIDFIFDDYPNAHYIGTLDYSYTYMEGTMDTANGSSGCWYGIIR